MDVQLYAVRCKWQLKVGLNSLVWCFLKPWQSVWLSLCSTADPNHPHDITLTLCPDLSWAQGNHFLSRGNSVELGGVLSIFNGIHALPIVLGDTVPSWVNTNWFQLWKRAWFWHTTKDSCTQHNAALHPPYNLKDQLSQDGDIYAHLHSFSAVAYSSTCSRVRDGRNGKQLVSSEESTLSHTRLPTCSPPGFPTWTLSMWSYARCEAGHSRQICGWEDARA